MADATGIDFGAVATALQDAIKQAFPGFAVVEYDREETDDLPLPACLIDSPEAEAVGSSDYGAGQQPLAVRFEAAIAVSFMDDKAATTAASLAMNLAAWLHTRRVVNIPGVMPAKVIGCFRDHFHPKVDQWRVWRVEWTHEIQFGVNVFDDDCADLDAIFSNGNPIVSGNAVKAVFVSAAPDIGAASLDKYIQVFPE